MKKFALVFICVFTLLLPACAATTTALALPQIGAGESAREASLFTDKNGDSAVIPKEFYVSKKADEQTVRGGLVIIGPDQNEFVWVPMSVSDFSNNQFASRGFNDETNGSEFKAMKASVEKYGGFYMGRYEASKASNGIPQSKKAASKDIWVHIPPQDMIPTCAKLYANNSGVTSFLPWGINWDRTLQWLVDTGTKTVRDVSSDSSSWGNYSNNKFGSKNYSATGEYEQTKANNIYDLAGNYWEWTQERSSGGGYAARSGGYTIMGGACPGSSYPASVRSGLPGNNHHPNITFRVALYVN